MRFPRNAKIFRGQVDMVPLVGVMFLLLIFILLGSLVYTPGIPITLDQELDVTTSERAILTITSTGTILFDGQTNGISDLERLREQLRKMPRGSTVIMNADPAAPRQVVVEVSKQVQNEKITLEASRVPILLPRANAVIGTPNPTVTVAVNLGGQFFFENRIISPLELHSRLSNVVSRTAQPLTLLVIADESVEHRVMMQLAEIANRAHIGKVLMVTRLPGQK